jgi:hypothetical protein
MGKLPKLMCDLGVGQALTENAATGPVPVRAKAAARTIWPSSSRSWASNSKSSIRPISSCSAFTDRASRRATSCETSSAYCSRSRALVWPCSALAP